MKSPMPRRMNSPTSATGTSQTIRGSLSMKVPSRKNLTNAAQPASVAAKIVIPSTPTANIALCGLRYVSRRLYICTAPAGIFRSTRLSALRPIVHRGDVDLPVSQAPRDVHCRHDGLVDGTRVRADGDGLRAIAFGRT